MWKEFCATLEKTRTFPRRRSTSNAPERQSRKNETNGTFIKIDALDFVQVTACAPTIFLLRSSHSATAQVRSTTDKLKQKPTTYA